MRKTRETVLQDIKDYPEQHYHDFNSLVACCTIGGVVDTSLMEAHSQYVNIGINGGIRCDVIDGPCVCGAWH